MNIFVYGSLILPTSLIARLKNLRYSTDQLYESKLDTIRSEALQEWNRIEHRIEYIPVKLRGYSRYYSLETKRDGCMLEAVRTNRSKDHINGILIRGLSKSEIQKITETENSYDNNTLDPYIISTYHRDDENKIPESEMTGYTNNSIPDPKANYNKNKKYHRRIVLGISMLRNNYDTQHVKSFYNDFLDTTYESRKINGKNQFVSLKEKHK